MCFTNHRSTEGTRTLNTQPSFSPLFLATCLAIATTESARADTASAPPSAPVVPTANAPATSAELRAGTVKEVQGQVWTGGTDAKTASEPGQGVVQGQRLSTGATGAATLLLKDGTVLTLGPNTTVDLSQFQYNATTQEGNFLLDLLQGSVRVVTGVLARINPDLFKIKTPTSVVGVRGTDFIVEARAAP